MKSPRRRQVYASVPTHSQWGLLFYPSPPLSANPCIPFPSARCQISGPRQAGRDEEWREEHAVISAHNCSLANRIFRNILFRERGCEDSRGVAAVDPPPPPTQPPHHLRASLLSAGLQGETPPTCLSDPFQVLTSRTPCFLTSNLNPSSHNQGLSQEEPQTTEQ